MIGAVFEAKRRFRLTGDLMKIRLSVSRLFVVLLVFLLVFSMGAWKKSPPTTAVAVGADWTMYGRTNDEQRFSPLSQINEQNIGQLGLLWDRELGTTRGLEATPLVSNGVIFTTGEWSVAYALDAKTGEITHEFGISFLVQNRVA